MIRGVLGSRASIGGVLGSGRGGAAASPVAGAVLWLDASQITGLSDGAAISTWTDATGNGYNATQGTSGAQPIYKANILNGKPVVRFNGSQWMDVSGVHSLFGGVAPATMIVVHKNDTSAARYQVIFSILNDTATRLYEIAADCRAPNTALGLRAGTSVKYTNPSAPQNVYAIDSFVCTGTLGAMYRNGTTLSSGVDLSTGVITVTRAAIGTRLSGTIEKTNGDIAEIIVYATALSDANRQAVEAYLGTKYGITVT